MPDHGEVVAEPRAIYGGYVLLARQFLESPHFQFNAPAIRCLMIACICKANHRTEHWHDGTHTLTIQRGQFVTTYPKMAAYACLTVPVVRRGLEKLCSEAFLRRESVKRSSRSYLIITIENYDDFQDHTNYSVERSERVDGSVSQEFVRKSAKNNKVIQEYRNEGRTDDPPSAAPTPPPAPPPTQAMTTLSNCQKIRVVVTGDQWAAWEGAFPDVDLCAEIRRADAWLLANNRTKVNYGRFLHNWFSRSQDKGRGGRVGGYDRPGKGEKMLSAGARWMEGKRDEA